MNRIVVLVVTLGTLLLGACGPSTSEAGTADGGPRSSNTDAAGAQNVDGGTADGASKPDEDAGGRVANFDYGAVCTASWLSHDLNRPIRFAVELKRGKLPNNSPSVTLWFTPLLATTHVVQSSETVGSTLHVPEESVGGYEFFDAILQSPNDTFVLPASATPDAQIAELAEIGVFGYVSKSNMCGWISGTLTKPTSQANAQLRCLFYPAGSPLPDPSTDDFDSSQCATGTFVWL